MALAFAAVVALTSGGRWETQRLAFLRGPQAVDAPGWTRPCWRDGRRPDAYTLPCARVRGRVLFRQGHDPDGDGDVHFVVAAGARIVVVKIPGGARSPRPPGIGNTLEAAGTLGRGRLGVAVVNAARLG